MKEAVNKLNVLIDNIEKVIVNKREAVKFMLVGLLTNGHVLIEDVPGMGKTMFALALAKSIGADFKRAQLTPDLLPSDITGGYIYNPKESEFEFKKGPVFTNILLADELNRTTPRTQSSLLECMQEYKVTADGKSFPLAKPFMVIATQNPIEFQGTYALPEAQIDRFLIKIKLGYLPVAEEVKVIKNQKSIHPVNTIGPVLKLEDVLYFQELVKKIEVSEKILDYIVRLVARTRRLDSVKIGASPRASIAFMHSARAWALLEGRDYVIPDDVFCLASPVLGHRLSLKPKASVSGLTPEAVVAGLVDKVPIN